MERYAIIGGTGVYRHTQLQDSREIIVSTRYGEALLQRGLIRGREVYFLARHGPGHAVPPHRVNYRANIAALKHLGVTAAIATAAVGSLRESIPPGSRVLIDQFLDFTRGRPLTYYDGEDGVVVHTDFTEPYCPSLRSAVSRAADILEQPLVMGGCYACTEGPRFETPAEVRALALLGADLVGMTNVPEVVLAREAGICYATVALVTNYGAGISMHFLTHDEVLEAMDKGKPGLDSLLVTALEQISPDRSCCCRHGGGDWIAREGAGGSGGIGGARGFPGNAGEGNSAGGGEGVSG